MQKRMTLTFPPEGAMYPEYVYHVAIPKPPTSKLRSSGNPPLSLGPFISAKCDVLVDVSGVETRPGVMHTKVYLVANDYTQAKHNKKVWEQLTRMKSEGQCAEIAVQHAMHAVFRNHERRTNERHTYN